ncbi:MAG: YhbY family RNA-binding protein [Candidatus Borkfalkiaceae bacterium]|nr:YhbY family RNA-binding protein [Christensenellaceae bacterium]
MLNSRQRANLRAIAQTAEPVTQLGKGGVNDAFIDGLNKAIEKRELIKVTVLENSGLNPKEAGFEIAEKLGAEFVCATGRKLVFYRRSENEKINHIEF